MESLGLRLAFTSAAARVNVVLPGAEGESKPDDPAKLDAAVRTLIEELDAPGADPELVEFRTRMKKVASYLIGTARHLRPDTGTPCPSWCVLDRTERPPGATGAYHHACWLAAISNEDEDEDAILEDLRMAFTEETLRGWARKDPSFAALRAAPGEPSTKFDKLAAEPDSGNALGIPLLSPYRKRLEEIGIDKDARRSPEDPPPGRGEVAHSGPGVPGEVRGGRVGALVDGAARRRSLH